MSWWPAALAGLGAAALSARFHWWRPRLAGAPVLMYHQIVKELDRTPCPSSGCRPGPWNASWPPWNAGATG